MITAGDATILVTFVPPADNGLPITGYAVTCVSSNGGTTASTVAGSSPVTVEGASNAKTYTCEVTATNGAGTSPPSPASNAVIVGVPAAPTITNTIGSAGALTVSFVANANDGSAITSYRVSCVSSNGGVPGALSAATSPIKVTGLTNGSTYTCLVTATNASGVSPPARVGPVVAAAPSHILASCSGTSGTVRVAPGLLLAVNNQHTFTLTAVLGNCSGPYVRAARVSLSFRSKRPVSCDNALGIPDNGSGTLTWTAPAGMGNSRAKTQLVIASTSGHTATRAPAGNRDLGGKPVHPREAHRDREPQTRHRAGRRLRECEPTQRLRRRHDHHHAFIDRRTHPCGDNRVQRCCLEP